MESANLSNVVLLEHYGVPFPPEGPGWKSILCPFHEDKTASARSNGKGFICNGCGVKGDAIALIRERESLDYSSAIDFYETITGAEHGSLRKTVIRKRVSFDVSSEKRSYEGNSGIFSARVGKRSAPRKRPRLSD